MLSNTWTPTPSKSDFRLEQWFSKRKLGKIECYNETQSNLTAILQEIRVQKAEKKAAKENKWKSRQCRVMKLKTDLGIHSEGGVQFDFC